MARTLRMVDGDLYFDVNGRVEVIAGVEKVQQDIAEVLLTDLDKSRDFGSMLNVLAYNPSFNVSKTQISSYISDAIARVRKLQRTNATTTTEEEIALVDDIQVFKSDQTEVLFGVSVITTAGQGANTSLRLAPKPVQLNHLLPPSTLAQSQEIQADSVRTTISGEEF